MSHWVGVTIDIGRSESFMLDDWNYTSNVSGMWETALGKPLREFRDAPCVEAAGVLAAGVQAMERDPEKYRAMNPPNGWGNYEGALECLRRLADACCEHPKAMVYVSC